MLRAPVMRVNLTIQALESAKKAFVPCVTNGGLVELKVGVDSVLNIIPAKVAFYFTINWTVRLQNKSRTWKNVNKKK